MNTTVPLAVIGRGFLKLNLILLPISILLTLYIGIMAGASPNSDRVSSVLTVVGFVFVLPAMLILAHIAGAKIFDGVLRIVPPTKPEISWAGIAVSAFLLVVAGNVFIDDLHQYNQGNYGISVYAFLIDMAGMAAVVFAGRGKKPESRLLP